MGSVNLLANRLAAEEAQGRYEEAVLPLTKELLAYCDRMAKSKQISFEEALAYRIGLLEEYGNQAEGETAYSEPLLRCMLEQGAGRDRDIGDRDKYYLVKLLYEYSHHLDEDRLGSLIDAVNATQDKALKRYFETLIDESDDIRGDVLKGVTNLIQDSDPLHFSRTAQAVKAARISQAWDLSIAIEALENFIHRRILQNSL